MPFDVWEKEIAYNQGKIDLLQEQMDELDIVHDKAEKWFGRFILFVISVLIGAMVVWVVG